ncbi:hypothetical protein AZE42_04397 [Rhizopogon vesiculosus]|uniref:Uncharacterized protein n=1 Tax=Rhizopogon vesiculosus TaxID=180088 RepID=A0A1J8QI06_9AGAM|nr:hypothetical protein AZE42_04397 [Rhizopogon vesiculosus]
MIASEQAQLAALREEQRPAPSKDNADAAPKDAAPPKSGSAMDRDFEGGFGGQEDLEDRYATTSGEH